MASRPASPSRSVAAAATMPDAEPGTRHLKPRGSSQGGLRQYNERVVLQAIRLHGPLAGAEMARLTQLTAQTISLITKRLLEDRSNGIQDAVWEVILNKGEGTLVDIREWEKESFEGVIRRHPKALIRFAG